MIIYILNKSIPPDIRSLPWPVSALLQVKHSWLPQTGCFPLDALIHPSVHTARVFSEASTQCCLPFIPLLCFLLLCCDFPQHCSVSSFGRTVPFWTSCGEEGVRFTSFCLDETIFCASAPAATIPPPPSFWNNILVPCFQFFPAKVSL